MLLQNEVTSIGQNGTPRTDVASLVSYGQAMPQGPSAMARTVGLPVALGTSLIVDGLFNEPGVHTPTSRKMWHPMLQLLDARDIRMKRRTLSRATDYNWLDV